MPDTPAQTFTIGDTHFLLDGRPMVIRCGEIHLARVPRPYWRDRLKKARAMGLNTVCAYLFWNAHQPTPGRINFADQFDAAAFVRMAQEEGLWVLLRPGPYVCAEWDFGGLPAWLLKTPDIKVRCMDERYTAPARRWLLEVGRQLAPLCVTRGGPILMVQVENEYGAYGNDSVYMAFVRDAIVDAGFDVPLFTCDWPEPHIHQAGSLAGVTGVANFGSGAKEKIAGFRTLRPTGPMMCGEFWCGWFDQWGRPRNGSGGVESAREIDWMLANDVSFSIYMFHGGTSFGFGAGANQYADYAPTVTSYDYHACLDEAGRPTAKYAAFADVIQQHAFEKQAGQSLPALPLAQPVITVAPFTPTQVAPLMDNLPQPVRRPQPVPMEMLDQAHGLILYRTQIHRGAGTQLKIEKPRDYAHVYLDGRRVATVDRMKRQNTATLPPIDHERARLDILVDALGRVNFGPEMIDPKGITHRVTLGHFTLMNWDIFPLHQNAAERGALRYRPVETAAVGDGRASEAATQTDAAAVSTESEPAANPPRGTTALEERVPVAPETTVAPEPPVAAGMTTAPGTPAAPGTPVSPGTPAAPGTPVLPGTPVAAETTLTPVASDTFPAYYRSAFSIDQPGDFFLDCRRWGKGMVWINGHNLGRYWSIGPQQTLFVPGCWLVAGENELVIFDLESTGPKPLQGLAEPILDDTPFFDRATAVATPGITGPG